MGHQPLPRLPAPRTNAPETPFNLTVSSVVVHMDRQGFLEKINLFDPDGRNYFITDMAYTEQVHRLLSLCVCDGRRHPLLGHPIPMSREVNVTLFPLRKMEYDDLVFDLDVHHVRIGHPANCPACGTPLEITVAGLRCVNIGRCPGRRMARMKFFCNENSAYFGDGIARSLETMTEYHDLSPIDLYDPDRINKLPVDLGRVERLSIDMCRKELIDALSGRGARDWNKFFVLTTINTLSIPGMTRNLALLTLEQCPPSMFEAYFEFLADLLEYSHPTNRGRPIDGECAYRLPFNETYGLPEWSELSFFIKELRRLNSIIQETLYVKGPPDINFTDYL